MVFSSIYFLLYFLPVVLVLYFLSPGRWKNVVALLASCFFYMWGAPQFFYFIFFSLIVDFYVVKLIHYSEGKTRKYLLWSLIVFDVGILLVAKYLNFFVENLNGLAAVFGSEGIKMAAIALPIGISFVTFQKLSYVVDCYQRKVKPLDSLWDYALYILLFPQLIAGPIVRFNEIADQLQDRAANDTVDDKLGGLIRFIIGLSKKVLIANILGAVVDDIFAQAPADISTSMAWIGIVAYSFQIYFDFSGYSDMAIGIARMLGFRFPENFNFPYISQNITEFWRRWHMTLSRWMRDYLYIPLGGNRVSTGRLYVNLCVVFLISGFWHGAAWTFVFWGAFHGFFLILDRLFLIKTMQRFGKIPSILITYLVVLIGWVFFRSPDFSYALDYIVRMFAFDGTVDFRMIDNRFWVMFFLAIIFAFSGFFKTIELRAPDWYEKTQNLTGLTLKTLVTISLGWLCLAEIFASDFNPFIYFKF